VALAELINDPQADIAAIASYLDSIARPARWSELSGLGRAAQRVLYGKAAGCEIGLGHLVGDGATEAIHDGRNTLPLPSPLRGFQKYFCRGADPAGLVGFNEGPTRRLIGPGYFVAVLTDGAVVFDYGRLPVSAPPAWPPVVPNTQGLQRFVFNGTRDTVRAVSADVCVGAAHRGDQPLDHYFVLCRRPSTLDQ
jgi:hypothetical protein